jgi:hypothetical protein
MCALYILREKSAGDAKLPIVLRPESVVRPEGVFPPQRQWRHLSLARRLTLSPQDDSQRIRHYCTPGMGNSVQILLKNFVCYLLKNLYFTEIWLRDLK